MEDLKENHQHDLSQEEANTLWESPMARESTNRKTWKAFGLFIDDKLLISSKMYNSNCWSLGQHSELLNSQRNLFPKIWLKDTLKGPLI